MSPRISTDARFPRLRRAACESGAFASRSERSHKSIQLSPEKFGVVRPTGDAHDGDAFRPNRDRNRDSLDLHRRCEVFGGTSRIVEQEIAGGWTWRAPHRGIWRPGATILTAVGVRRRHMRRRSPLASRRFDQLRDSVPDRPRLTRRWASEAGRCDVRHYIASNRTRIQLSQGRIAA